MDAVLLLMIKQKEEPVLLQCIMILLQIIISVAQYARHSLDWLSHNWPGVPYPYEKTTVFQGYADMEYPMMANDETYDDTLFSRFVAEHEIAHTYMPFYMGINETRYGFMDEGWATTFEYLIGTADMGEEKATGFYKQFRIAGMTEDNLHLMNKYLL